MNDSEFFHHPSWHEPWNHPDFTIPHDERLARWKSQGWFKDRRRASVEFMGRLKWPWGFIIYRTVYTPESDRLWSACLDKIEGSVRRDIDESGEKYADQYPERILKETFKNVILEDRECWDFASVEQIRADFIAYLQSMGSSIGDDVPRSTVCLVINDACLQSIRNTFDEPENNRGSWAPTGFVGAIDPDYTEGQSYDNMEYRGFMRVQITSLYELVAGQLGYFSMHEVCPIMYHDMYPRVVDPRKVPLYKGL
ncbi:uncharacterized protein N7473_006487 [Penicillium subrubescens]|uniref:Uncharacterized protein n=1 Tax=Penicillium subrubescens TaxID=1316194 RepID=A0A1Q5TCV6_9EURO|nr:uncharacterized protein N7473_006487 [Penicillium subrubescens]KAJ5897088.1 hypothetical protein N7473_006487 [Penicillium subrubescens]OKO98052.1 hypothetical protein PENSUB_9632 [Penicillium subrubescens]